MRIEPDSTFPSVPRLALPMTGKSTMLWLEDQEEHFKSHGENVTRVLSIGWRAEEPTFVEMLRSTYAPDAEVLTCVGGPFEEEVLAIEAHKIRERIGFNIGKQSHEFLGGFQKLLKTREELDWLLA